MSFLGKLFGKKSPAPSAPPSADPSKDPNMIKVFDAYGREMFITKQAWRDSVLLDHLKKVWNDADQLYTTIVQSLQDGFGAEMIKPAERLAALDQNAERGAVVLAVVYREQKRLDDCEKVLRRYIERHGESGLVLTNLAKIHSDRGQDEESLRTLWRGLELDPNQENGLGWYTAIFREKDGEAGFLAALRRIASLPHSWRARLWLARDALTRRQLNEALALYGEALALTPRPVPTDFLQQLSGDLGNHGHLPELLHLAEPLFELEVHGLAVGNNLIKAHLDLGRLDAARALLDRLYAQKRMDWKESLSFWDTEIAKARTAVANPPPGEKFSVAMLVGEGPVWLPGESPASELFPIVPGTPVRLAFLGSSAETPTPGAKPIHQMSDGPGWMSRALPLFFAEYVKFHGAADVRTIVPWLQGDSPAFVLAGVRWEDATAAQHARAGETPADYLVLTHLNANSDPWTVDLRLIRTIDARCLGTAVMAFPAAQPETAVRQVADDLVHLLRQHAEFTAAPPPSFYVTPTGAAFAHYLLRLEQLLAVRCSGMDNTPDAFLSGTREIIDGNLQLCLNQPANTVVRLLLVQTAQRMKKTHPLVVEEYRDKIRLLQKEKPLPATAQAVVERLLTEVYP